MEPGQKMLKSTPLSLKQVFYWLMGAKNMQFVKI